MSIPAVNWALSQRTGSSSKKAVLKCIAEWMIGERAVDCYPTVEQIAFETELNRQTVMEATRELAKAGLITKRRVCKTFVGRRITALLVMYPKSGLGLVALRCVQPNSRTYRMPKVRETVRPGKQPSMVWETGLSKV